MAWHGCGCLGLLAIYVLQYDKHITLWSSSPWAHLIFSLSLSLVRSLARLIIRYRWAMQVSAGIDIYSLRARSLGAMAAAIFIHISRALGP